MNPAIICALLAAALFGISTPLAKVLLDDTSAILLAGLLYFGSGVGLLAVRILRDRGWQASGLTRAEWPWLAGAIVFGGILGPVLLMLGLSRTSAATASLLLNLEAVLTALMAWFVFRENADRRIVLGMVAIVAGGIVLSWPAGNTGHDSLGGPLAIAGACLCWAVDNNLTRKVAVADAFFIAASKGAIAGASNIALALWLGDTLPGPGLTAFAMLAGLGGYGISLVLFVLALRGLGAARTGAYFATAPFIGAAVALFLPGDAVSASFWLAAGLMSFGVWLHLTERHEHDHLHEAIEHSHPHTHAPDSVDGQHHRHTHLAGEESASPHTHWHRHAPLRHKHPHFPDLHHRHVH